MPITTRTARIDAGANQIVSSKVDLAQALNLEAGAVRVDTLGPAHFPLRVPAAFIGRMNPGDPNDPLLRQILPSAEEDVAVPGYHDDPVSDVAHLAVSGLIHKYSSRALLIATGACSIHCRYCFRRNFPYAEHALRESALDEIVVYLSANPAIKELILSGGDPLTLSARRLGTILEKVASVKSLALVRIHSRNPVVMPASVSDELISVLSSSRLPLSLVLHANHANEIDASVRSAVSRLRTACPIILNQSVLLRGVNDSLEALTALSYALARAGVVPYYLNLLDRATGTGHFEVPEAEALSLMEALREQLPGYLVPRLVRDQCGESSKSVLY